MDASRPLRSRPGEYARPRCHRRRTAHRCVPRRRKTPPRVRCTADAGGRRTRLRRRQFSGEYPTIHKEIRRIARNQEPVSEEEIEALREEMDEQREDIREALTEDRAGEPMADGGE